MEYQSELKPGRLLKRYKRFLADITLATGEKITAHCPNPGRMTGLDGPGTPVWVEYVASPTRKLDWSWKLSTAESGALVGIDTEAGNRIFEPFLRAGLVPELAGLTHVEREVSVGAHSRLDFRVSGGGGTCMIELKSVTLSREPGLAEFPDAKSLRAAKHMRALQQLAEQGERAAVMFLVQRGDCTAFDVARDIDPAYATALNEALEAGVQLLCYACAVSPLGINVAERITDIRL